jgi:hypothetical protein
MKVVTIVAFTLLSVFPSEAGQRRQQNTSLGNHLTSARHDRAAMFCPDRLGLAIQVEGRLEAENAGGTIIGEPVQPLALGPS